MAYQSPEQLRKGAKLTKAGAAIAALSAVVALVIVFVRGGSVLNFLPLSLLLFVAVGGLLAAAGGLEKRAEEAERDSQQSPAR